MNATTHPQVKEYVTDSYRMVLDERRNQIIFQPKGGRVERFVFPDGPTLRDWSLVLDFAEIL